MPNQLVVIISYKLGEENSSISYTRYTTPSAYRESGAFLPKKLVKKNIYRYRLSPYMGCPKRCDYCFELHDEYINKDQVKIKTNTVDRVKKKISEQEKRTSYFWMAMIVKERR